MNCRIKVVLAVIALGMWVSPVMAAANLDAPATTRISPALVGAEFDGSDLRASCSIVNIQGELAAGFLSWTTPGGGMMVYFDPAGTGGAGSPGCGASPYPFLIQNVQFQIADASGFGLPGEGLGTLQFAVDITCPTTAGMPCSQPGLEVFRSATQTLVATDATLYNINIPVNTCVEGPFFVSVHFLSWTGTAGRVPTILWDDVARPVCRQWITTDGGTTWTDHTDFFTPPGNDTGWANIVVNGNTQDACTPGNCVLPNGACCLPDGSCVGDTSPSECIADGGVFQGADSTCASVECPQPPTGACCDGDGACTEGVTEFDCPEFYLGDDSVCGNDCDDDSIVDACAIALDFSEDCQGNGIPDECDIAAGTSRDLDTNGIPDECEGCQSLAACPETDVNCDNVTDGFDIAVVRNTSNWLKATGLAAEPRADVNGDGIIDGFDIAAIRNTQCWLMGGIVDLELAGNSLLLYPYFEYVRAFNENATVEVAVDPTRFPSIAGKTCDIYIVEAKTAAEWTADTLLIDVTAGGASSETFSAGTIQANTFEVAGPSELDADAGTGFGVGYDMVLDCNRDGRLSGGDYIDGRGDEAGLYAIHDHTQNGPLAVTEIFRSTGAVFGIPSTRQGQDVYYPTAVSTMGELPLIIVSHGNGHDYSWYDHLGIYFGSYGYIVVSHQNDTVPGTETAATTTLGHTDAFIDQLATVSGGILVGHLDTSRIMWIGHSRGADGVAIAYDRLFDGTHVPVHYDINDIQLISSMLPVDFGGTANSNPHDANYHLWTASGDADVSGIPSSDSAQTFHLHDRATHYRHSTVVYGTGHGDFHNASGSVFDGPCHVVPKSRVHDIMQGMFLPLVKYYFEGNIPAQDFFWRQYEQFHPIGVPEGTDPCIVVNNTFRNGNPVGNVTIDDFQTNPATNLSSSGGAVTFDVQNLAEDRLDDRDSSFTWVASDPWNGFTYGRVTDTTRGTVFDWSGTSRFYEQAIVPALRDFSDNHYLSFRTAQQSRHPLTTAVLGDVTFTVTLRDGAGTTSSINIGAYGAGVEEPYQRTGAGTGAGWSSDFETIKIRLTDFLHNGSGLDLSDIVAVRFNFGPAFGSNEGRIGLDEIMLTNDPMPN